MTKCNFSGLESSGRYLTLALKNLVSLIFCIKLIFFSE